MNYYQWAIYAPSVGWGSMRVVADAFHRLASAICPDGKGIWVNGDEAQFDTSSDAPVAFIFGSHKQIEAAQYASSRKWYLVAANSTWIPKDLLSLAVTTGCNLMCPSEYSKAQVEACLDRYELRGLRKEPIDVVVVPHGLPPTTGRMPVAPKAHRLPLRVLHTAESSIERKGTLQLLEAAESLLEASKIYLTLVVSERDISRVAQFVEERMPKCAESIDLQARWNCNQGQMLWRIAHFDLVVQPSLQEGFGLVPLEALGLGVPVVCSYFGGQTPSIDLAQDLTEPLGVLDCSAGLELVPAEYEPGLVPRWSVEAIRMALQEATSLEEYEFLANRARYMRDKVTKTMGWMQQTGPFLRAQLACENQPENS